MLKQQRELRCSADGPTGYYTKGQLSPSCSREICRQLYLHGCVSPGVRVGVEQNHAAKLHPNCEQMNYWIKF